MITRVDRVLIEIILKISVDAFSEDAYIQFINNGAGGLGL